MNRQRPTSRRRPTGKTGTARREHMGSAALARRPDPALPGTALVTQHPGAPAPAPSSPSLTSQHSLGRQGRHHAVGELLQQHLVENHKVVVPSVHRGLEALQEKGCVLRLDPRKLPCSPSATTQSPWERCGSAPHPARRAPRGQSPSPPAVLTRLSGTVWREHPVPLPIPRALPKQPHFSHESARAQQGPCPHHRRMMPPSLLSGGRPPVRSHTARARQARPSAGRPDAAQEARTSVRLKFHQTSCH